MPAPCSPTIRADIVEAVVERGRTIGQVARSSGRAKVSIRRWVHEHRSGVLTIAMLRSECDSAPTRAGSFQLAAATAAAPLALAEVVEAAGMRGRRFSDEQKLHRTAAYVLHPDAPMDHFVAWLRIFARKWGMD